MDEAVRKIFANPEVISLVAETGALIEKGVNEIAENSKVSSARAAAVVATEVFTAIMVSVYLMNIDDSLTKEEFSEHTGNMVKGVLIEQLKEMQ